MDYNEYDEPQDWAKSSMKFEVNITNSQEDFFVREIADRLCDRVSKEMIERVESKAHELIETRVVARLEEVVTEVIEKGLSREVQPSDQFSTPKGQPVTPLEFIAKGAENFLEQHVDDKGNVVSPSAYNRTTRRIDQFMKGVITRQFEDEINREVKSIKAEILSQMKAAASAWLAKFQAETAAGIEKAKALGSAIR